MVGSILSHVTGQLERRFVLNALFPTLVLSLLVALVAAEALGGAGGLVDGWERQAPFVQTLIVVSWVGVVFIVANILANGALWIIRLFEGYAAPTSWFAAWGRNYQHARASKVLERDPDEFERNYPLHPRPLAKDDVAPTRLGNILRSAESYAKARYGVDAVRVWSRLYHLLPEGLRTSMAEARASMEFFLVIAFLAAVYTPGSCIFLIAVAGSNWWFIGSLLGGSALGIVAYWGALTPAAIYGDHIRAAFDLHRLELLEAIQVPAPATLEEERRLWAHAVQFLDRGDAHVWRYVRPR